MMVYKKILINIRISCHTDSTVQLYDLPGFRRILHTLHWTSLKIWDLRPPGPCSCDRYESLRRLESEAWWSKLWDGKDWRSRERRPIVPLFHSGRFISRHVGLERLGEPYGSISSHPQDWRLPNMPMLLGWRMINHRIWMVLWCFTQISSSQTDYSNLLVLNVGNGWVAGGCWEYYSYSYCGSFPKIPLRKTHQ